MSKLRIQIEKSELIKLIFNRIFEEIISDVDFDLNALINKYDFNSLIIELQTSDKFETDFIKYLETNKSRNTLLKVRKEVIDHAGSDLVDETYVHDESPNSFTNKSTDKNGSTNFRTELIHSSNNLAYIERIPISNDGETILLPTTEIVTIIANGELLYFKTIDNQTYKMNYRLKDLYLHLNQHKFIKLSRSAVGNIEMIKRIQHNPGEAYVVEFMNGQKVAVSRLQLKNFRNQLLKI